MPDRPNVVFILVDNVGYHEFEAKNRPEGWSAWLRLAIPLNSGSQ